MILEGTKVMKISLDANRKKNKDKFIHKINNNFCIVTESGILTTNALQREHLKLPLADFFFFKSGRL